MKPMLAVSEGTSEKEPITDLERGVIYSQGNLKTFNKLLVKLTNKEQPKVCRVLRE